jgi:hypothetical protein
MTHNFKRKVRSLDLAGLPEREEARDVIRKQEQEETSTAEAFRRGFDSAFAEQRRKIRLRELAQADPAMYFFLVKNRSVESA